MTRSARYAALCSACLAGLLLSACGKHPAPAPAPAPASQPAARPTVTTPAAKPASSATTPPAHSGTAANPVAPAMAASAALSVASVTLGNAVNAAHQVDQASDRFAPGDKVTVEITEGRRPVLQLPVTAAVEDYSGLAAYIDRRELNRILAEGDNASGGQLLVASDLRRRFYDALERAPMVVGASSRDDTVANWRVVMTGAFRTNIMFYVTFAGAIAFGVAYNMSRVSLQERGRDLATLHVLGFGHAECIYILLGEIALLALAAIPLGVLGGNGLARGLIALYSRQDLRLPATISARSYGLSITAYLAAIALASTLTARRIWKLDLVAVLKTRE